MNDSALLYLFIILLAVFGVLLALMMLKYLSLVKRIQKDKDDKELGSLKDGNLAQNSLAQADSQAKKIIESAYAKAQAVASEAVSFRQKEHSLAQEVFDKAIKTEVEQLQKDIQETRTKSIEVLNTATQSTINEVQQLVDQTAQILQKQTQETTSNIVKELSSNISKTETEISNLKRIRIEQFEADLSKLTKVLSIQILRKQIGEEEHKKLVTEALAQFKKDVLSNN